MENDYSSEAMKRYFMEVLFDEAIAFEYIKNTFSLRNAVLNACEKSSNIFPLRKKFVIKMIKKGSVNE